MSYNIDDVRILSGKLSINRTAARQFAAAQDWMPECNFIEEIPDGDDEDAILERLDWCGEGSGHRLEMFLEALRLTKGTATILLTWEGGDSFSGYKIKDGVVTEKKVKMALE